MPGVRAAVLGSSSRVVEPGRSSLEEQQQPSIPAMKQQQHPHHHRLASREEEPTAPLSDLDSASSDEGDGLVVRNNSTTEDADDEADEDDAHKTTEWQAFVHLLKGYVGPGCLSLPWAVSQLGIAWGCLAIAAVAGWTSFNCWVVVQLKLRYLGEQRQQQQQQQSNNNNYAVVASTTATTVSSSNVTYPCLARWLWGRSAQALLTAAVCVQQLAVCTVFLSFLGANLRAVLEEALPALPVHHAAVVTAALPAVLALVVLVPDLRALAPFMLAATLLLLVGLALLLGLAAAEWGDRPDRGGTVTAEVPRSAVPLAACAILYSFEGVCLVLPVQGSMRRPRNFGPVFGGAMAAAAATFALVAGLSVAAFGSVTSGSITAFLLERYDSISSPDDSSEQLRRVLLLANAAVSLSVLITYPLQLFPCFELVGPLLKGGGGSGGGCCCSKNRIPPRGRRRRRRRAPLAAVTTQTPSGERADFAALASDEEHEHGNGAVDGGDDDDNNNDDDPAANRPNTSGAAVGSDDELGLSDRTATDEAPAATANSGSGDTPVGRVALVLVTYILAVAVPNVEAMISLAGALAGSLVALLVPPAMHIACQRRRQLLLLGEQQQSQQQTDIIGADTSEGVARSYLLFAAGFVFMVIGTGASILDIVEVYSNK